MTNPDLQRNVQEITRGSPAGYFVVVDSRPEDDEVMTLQDFAAAAVRSWKVVIGSVLVGTAIAIGAGLLMRPVFRAETLLVPVNPQGANAGSALRGQLGGLAALAGINTGDDVSFREQAVATLSSAGFTRDFISAENLMPVLYADRWDAAANDWRKDKQIPRMAEAVKRFTDDVRTVSEDRRTGLVTLTIQWYSAELAATWANKLVERVNERMRATAMQNAQRSIEYLNTELAKSNAVALQQAVSRLIEQEVNNAMLANVQREYAFRVVDPAVAPFKRTSPRRTVMALIGALLGAFAGLIWVIVNAKSQRTKPETGRR